MVFGRQVDAERIATANKAAAVGYLMLGKFKFSGWGDFLKNTDASELIKLPRRNLKGGAEDVRERLLPEIEGFCRNNFQGMSTDVLASLHDAIKPTIPHGFRLPLAEFQKKYAAPKAETLKDVPLHATVSISLWGLQFEFPEDHFMKDIEVALDGANAAHKIVEDIGASNVVKTREKELAGALRREKAACRAGLVACFSLVEAYLNGLAWRFCHNEPQRLAQLSQNQQKLIMDSSEATLRNKLLKYPEIIMGSPLWDEKDDAVDSFLSLLKPFRDSLCHPSPFEAPQKFGGYDKLSMVYGLTRDTFAVGAMVTMTLVDRIHRHIDGAKEPPHWMSLRVEVKPSPSKTSTNSLKQ